MILPSFKQIFLFEFLEADKWEGQRFFLNLLFLSKQLKINIPMAYFEVTNISFENSFF